MRFRVWASAITVIVLALEGAFLAMNWSHPSCPPGERIRMPMPFEHNGGRSWYVALPELERLADNVTEIPDRSPIVVCEGKRVLGPAHTLHKDIKDYGHGQYSHWGPYVLFSTSDNSDPNENGRSYMAVRTAVSKSPGPSQQAVSKNTVLTDRDGRTLYTFDEDSDGKSTCTGACAKIWPPYTHQVESHNPSLPGHWSVITRDDGTKMWAFKGKPLYYFTGDQAPGESRGDGAGGLWHVARPAR